MIFSHTEAASITTVVVLASFVNGLTYPKVSRDSTVGDKYNGVVVPDPYRWLETTNSKATKSFVASQNNLSRTYFHRCPYREQIKDRLTKVWNYRKVNPPQKFGNHYFYYANDGLQNQK